MAFCRINGVVLPVYAGSESSYEPQLIEDTSRMEDGTLFVDRRAEKGKWEVGLSPIFAAQAAALRRWVHGDGHYWSFDTHLYSSKGLGPSSVTGSPTIGSSSPSPWLGAGRVAVSATGVLQFTALDSGSPWTISVARQVQVMGWNHYIINSLSQKWVNGARNDAASTTFIGVSSGVVSLTADASFATYWDELVIYPFTFPTDWPSQLYDFQNPGTGNKQIGSLRQLKLDGDVVDTGAVKTVIGHVGGSKTKYAKTSGTRTPVRLLEIELEEV